MEPQPLSEIWKERFDFYEQNGLPSQLSFRQALKTLKFGQRSRINFNFYAFFFGFVYFCVLGLWKRGLLLFFIGCAINIAVAIVEMMTNQDLESVYRGMNMGYAFYCAITANVAYYLHRVKGVDTCNPAAGIIKKNTDYYISLPSNKY